MTSKSFVSDLEAEYYVDGEFAKCTDCNLPIMLDSTCMVCSKSYAVALKDQKAWFAKAKKDEQNAIANTPTPTKPIQTGPFPKRLEDITPPIPGITVPLFTVFANKIAPLEKHAKWDVSILGDTALEALQAVAPLYAASSNAHKGRIVDGLGRRTIDDDAVMENLLNYISSKGATVPPSIS